MHKTETWKEKTRDAIVIVLNRSEVGCYMRKVLKDETVLCVLNNIVDLLQIPTIINAQ